MKKLILLITLLLAACGGAPGSTTNPQTAALPHVDNLPIYDVPIDAAPAEVQAMWNEYNRARAVVLPQPTSTTLADLDAWVHRDFGPWLESQSSAVDRFSALPPNPRSIDHVFTTVLSADILYGVAQALLDMPVPDEIRGDAEAERIYISAIVEQLLAVSQTTRELLRMCQEHAQTMTAPYNAWNQRCAEMDAQIQNETAEFQQ